MRVVVSQLFAVYFRADGARVGWLLSHFPAGRGSVSTARLAAWALLTTHVRRGRLTASSTLMGIGCEIGNYQYV